MTTPTSASTSDSSSDFQSLQALRPVAQNSIEFSRNAKGEPAWSIKLYFAVGDLSLPVVDSIGLIDSHLAQRFRPAWSGLPALKSLNGTD